MSPVICCMSPVTCHLSLTPTVTAIDPPLANSPTMHSRLVCKYPKTQKIISKRKEITKQQNGPKHLRFVNISDLVFNQKSPVQTVWASPTIMCHGTNTHTDIATTGLNRPWGRFSENMFVNDGYPYYDPF